LRSSEAATALEHRQPKQQARRLLQGIEFQQGRLHEKTDKIGLHPGRALGAVFRYAQVTGDDTPSALGSNGLDPVDIGRVGGEPGAQRHGLTAARQQLVDRARDAG